MLNQYEDELNNYLSKNDKKEEKLIDKINDGTIKIGDYIKYTHDTASTTEILQELNTYSGADTNTTSTLTQENLNWRVLDVKEGQVRLISELPTTSTIALSGYNGYNNAVKLIDDTCNVLYSNSKLASKVQNLKIEDIQEKMVETNYSNITAEYGTEWTPANKYYPSILAKEKEQNVNGIAGTELGLSEQKELINQTTSQQANSWKIKFTYWYKTMSTEDFKNDKYYELFINNGSNYSTYWMSSRCVFADDNVSYIYIRNIGAGYINANYLYQSYNYGNSVNNAFRPIVTLNTNVLIDTTNSRDGSTAEQAYLIK